MKEHSYKYLLSCLIFLVFSLEVRAEYRAYILEIYDLIDKTRRTETTGFSPDKYILTHGGVDRVSVMVKATWHCYGDTSRFSPVCPKPEPIDPKFRVGDTVEVKLQKHVTHGWEGVVELALYREDLKSNVYGIRFTTRRNLYNRYFEYDLALKKRKEEKNASPPTQPANQIRPPQL